MEQDNWIYGSVAQKKRWIRHTDFGSHQHPTRIECNSTEIEIWTKKTAKTGARGSETFKRGAED